MNPSDENMHTPEFSFREDGDRPHVAEYAANVKFRPNEEVYLYIPATKTREGPYTVSSVEDGRYTLCDANLEAVHGNKAFEEKDLELYNPFG